MLCLLHGLHEKDFYYRSIDFFLMSIRDCLLFRSVIKSHECEVSSMKNVLQDLVKEWLITPSRLPTFNVEDKPMLQRGIRPICSEEFGLFAVRKSAYNLGVGSA